MGATVGRMGHLAGFGACRFCPCLPWNGAGLQADACAVGEKGAFVQWYELIFVLIDLRSFSNLWYWIGLAVVWSSASHWVIGVPFDMIGRARRHGGTAAEDLATLARINSGRLLYISRAAGAWVIGTVCFVLTLLGLLAVFYGVELAQAVLLLFAPMVLVGYLSLRTALRIETEAPVGDALIRRLVRHRFAVQLIAMVSIFVTALFGMYQNLAS